MAQGPRGIRRLRREALRRPLLRRFAGRHLPHRPVQEGRHLEAAELDGAYAADAKKLLAKNPKKGFSPLYIAGTDWYVAMGFVFDYGGGIAQRVSGKWKGLLASPKSIAGLTAYKNFFLATRGPRRRPMRRTRTRTTSTRRARRPRWSARAGSAAASARSTRPSTAQFVMPGHVTGKAMPGFLGGSDLAVPVTSSNKALAADWIKDFTSTSSEKGLQAKGNIPNATNLLGNERERAGCLPQLVRPDGQALGRRREREHPPQHAGADPHRQADRQAGGVSRPATTSPRC